MARGVSISADVLHRWLEDQGIEIRKGRRSVLAVVNGAEVQIPGDFKKQQVDERAMSQLARALGTTKSELIETITGSKRPNAGSLSAPAAAPPVVHAARDQILGWLKELEGLSRQASSFLLGGKRGTEIQEDYARAAEACIHALRPVVERTAGALRKAAATSIESPDDSKHRPTYIDPLARGAARVSGDSLRLAKKGTTETRYQLNERDGAA